MGYSMRCQSGQNSNTMKTQTNINIKDVLSLGVLSI